MTELGSFSWDLQNPSQKCKLTHREELPPGDRSPSQRRSIAVLTPPKLLEVPRKVSTQPIGHLRCGAVLGGARRGVRSTRAAASFPGPARRCCRAGGDSHLHPLGGSWLRGSWVESVTEPLPTASCHDTHILSIITCIYYESEYIHIYNVCIVHTYLPTYLHAYVRTYVRTYVHTSIHTCTQTYIPSHIRTHALHGRFPADGGLVHSTLSFFG